MNSNSEKDKNFKEIKLEIANFNDFYLYTDSTMWEILLTDKKKHQNKMLDILIREGVKDNFVTEYQILVKTTNDKYKCRDSNNVLCSALEEKLRKEPKFKYEIENSIHKYFSKETIIFYTQNHHIRIFSKTI